MICAIVINTQTPDTGRTDYRHVTFELYQVHFCLELFNFCLELRKFY